MKKYVVWIVILVTVVDIVKGVIHPAQGFIQTSQAVQWPPALTLALGALLVGLLTAGFNYIYTLIGLDLESYATPLSVTLSTFLGLTAQNWINGVPLQYDPIMQLVLNILVMVVGGAAVFGFVRTRAYLPVSTYQSDPSPSMSSSDVNKKRR